MMRPKVSVIVPVYNVETFLPQCVDSIIEQSYRNLEILLIDDGSSDTSPEMCETYARKDPRITAYHKQNGGATSARKAGLEMASGEYVLFVDSDDWLDIDMIRQMVQAARRDHADCVLCSYMKEYEQESDENYLFSGAFCYGSEDAEKFIHQQLIGPDVQAMRYPHKINNLSTTWGKLYTREAANRGLLVNEREVGCTEDTLYNIYALEGCRCVSYIHACLYHYRKYNSASLTTGYRQNLPDQYEVFYRLVEQYIQEAGKIEYEPLLRNRVACSMITLGINEINSTMSIPGKVKNLCAILNNPRYIQAFGALDTTCSPVHWKVFFLLCKHRCAILLWMLLAVMELLRTRKNSAVKQSS